MWLSKNHFVPLSLENYKSLRQQFTGASLQHRDSYLLGVLSAGLRSTSEKTQTGSVRTRQAFMYHVHGHKVCITVFKLMFDIGGKHLRRLQKHASLGLCFSEPHGNVGRKPWNTVSESDRERVVQFLKNYAAVFGLPMPAAPRGRGHTAPTYLPASNTYSSVHAEYVRAQEQETTVSLRSFRRIWKRSLPELKFMVPTEDVCAKCESLRDRLRVEISEQGKLDITKCLKEHVESAQAERAFYNSAIENAKSDPKFSHITFDFSENFCLPYHSRQPGPVYFKVLMRVNDFGICNEGAGEQVHYLFNEVQTIGVDNGRSHGPNAVTSMLHSYLSDVSHGPVLHAPL